jgi:hypothetical protein
MVVIDTYDIGLHNWFEAQKMVITLNQAAYKGYSDWRLPDRNELLFIHHNKEKIPNLNGLTYWSASENVSFNPWKINMKSGERFNCNSKEHFAEKNSLRLVRNKSQIEKEFQIFPICQIVQSFDNFSILTMIHSEQSWENIKELINSLNTLNFSNRSDWKLPTISDLEVIYQNKSHLELPNLSWVWTSSEEKNYNAYKLNFLTGEKYHCNKISDYKETKSGVLLICKP